MMVTGGHGVRMQWDYTRTRRACPARVVRGHPALAAADPRPATRSPATTPPTARTGPGRHRHAGRAAVDRRRPGCSPPRRTTEYDSAVLRRRAAGTAAPPRPPPSSTTSAGRAGQAARGPAATSAADRRVRERRVPPGRRPVHRDRVRRHRAGRAGPAGGGSAVTAALPGRHVRRADRGGRGGDDVHHRRVPAGPDPHHAGRQPAARPGAGGQGRRDRRGRLRGRAGRRRGRGSCRRARCARSSGIFSLPGERR